ncbi:MAG: Fic family protein [Candidatus Omnitrophota bacterium]
MTENRVKYIWQNKNWTKFSWDSGRLLSLLGKARKVQGRVLSRVKSLAVTLTSEAQAEILIEEAVKTSAIEGEVLNRDSVRSSVDRHLGLSHAGLSKAERHIDGLVEILLDATRHYDQPLKAQRLKAWQAALFPTGYSGLFKVRAGQWRSGDVQVVSGPVGREKVHFQAPPASAIDEEIRGFLHWWEKDSADVEGFLRAGIAHFWFVTIHPFDDGNGRVTRALTDMALAQDELLPMRFYSLSSQIMEERNGYYDVLEKSSKGSGDISLWLEWFLGCLTRAMERSEVTIARVLAKAEFWQIHSQTGMNERQRKIVNRLLDAGEGRFQGGLTTRKYVSLAKTSRATAFREIADLVDKKVLVRRAEGQGRSVSYELNWWAIA